MRAPLILVTLLQTSLFFEYSLVLGLTEQSDDEKQLLNYFVHIPKAAGSSAGYKLNKYANDSENSGGPGGFVCNHLAQPVANWKAMWAEYDEDKKQKCTMHISESVYTSEAKFIYTIVRRPNEHVLSQYFHCTESNEHAELKDLMPSLDSWLNTWANAKREGNNSTLIHELTEKFRCYVPINLQSTRLAFTKDTTKEEFSSRYSVIGLADQYEKTLCAIAIKWLNNGEYVPPECDCTDMEESHDSRRNLRGGDHGVTHHGGSFVTTTSQRKAIDYLTDADQFLYEYAKDIFEKEVRAIEEEHSIKLCG